MTANWTQQWPGVAATWHPSRNGRLTAGKVGRSWPGKVWWRCPAGHEWQERISTRVTLPKWKGGDRAACRECTGSPVALVTYTYPECGHTRRIMQKNRDKIPAVCWRCTQKQRDEQWRAAAETAKESAPQAAELVGQIEQDYLSPGTPAPLAFEFHRLATKLLQGAIGAEHAGIRQGEIGRIKGQLRNEARTLLPTTEQAAAAADGTGVLKILDQAHWAAGWVHHLTCAQPHPVSRGDLDEAAGLVARLTENALPAVQPGWRTADTTAFLTHAIAELPRRVRYKYASDNHWRTYRELRLPVLARDGAVRYGRLDLVIWHPEFPDIVVEIDSKPNPASARKLEFARDAGACPVWVRHGSGGITAPDGVAVIDLRQ